MDIDSTDVRINSISSRLSTAEIEKMRHGLVLKLSGRLLGRLFYISLANLQWLGFVFNNAAFVPISVIHAEIWWQDKASRLAEDFSVIISSYHLITSHAEHESHT